MRSNILITISAGLLFTGFAWLCLGQGTGSAVDRDIAPTGKGLLTRDQAAKASAALIAPAPITYHLGPVMLAPTNIHYIWYGSWGTNSAIPILENLAREIGGSPWFNINSTYYSNFNLSQHVQNFVSFAGGVHVPSSTHGIILSDAMIRAIVAEQKPDDPNGVYFVLTSAEVTASSGFCTKYCGWHTHAFLPDANNVFRDIKYAFIGNTERCPSACQIQGNGPNDNAGADGMASIIAHELSEAVTDPDLNAWYDRSGQENADKCAWTYGQIQTAPNGTLFNVTWGAHRYLIQQNWVHSFTPGCALKYP